VRIGPRKTKEQAVARTLEALTPLLGAVFIVFFVPLVHALVAVPPNELELTVLSYVPSVFVVLWMAADAQRRRLTPCYDFGFLMLLLFPLTLLGYLLWTRGWWGIVVFIGMLALMYFPWIAIDMIRMLVAR
jgi:hypothetical protein